jgi:Uma2 family endonuclease
MLAWGSCGCQALKRKKRMASISETRATLEDLARVEGRAELIGGRIVPLMASGDAPSDVALAIAVSLHAHVKRTGHGVAKADGTGYAVQELASGRESFQPDASYYDGPRPSDRMRFIQGAPKFAVEVRSENDYGPAAEIEMAAKRDDYFAAGTEVVWDVDPVNEVVHVYRSSDPHISQTIHRGQTADAERSVPGWMMPVNEVFPW